MFFVNIRWTLPLNYHYRRSSSSFFPSFYIPFSVLVSLCPSPRILLCLFLCLPVSLCHLVEPLVAVFHTCHLFLNVSSRLHGPYNDLMDIISVYVGNVRYYRFFRITQCSNC